MSLRGLSFVYEQFGPQKTDVAFPLRSLPTAESVRVPVGPAASIPPPNTIRTSTARPKPTNAVIPVARMADEQIMAGEVVLVAKNKNRMATVATLRTVNQMLDRPIAGAPAINTTPARFADGRVDPTPVRVEGVPDEVARWTPDGICVNAELNADELSGDALGMFGSRGAERLVNVAVAGGPTPLLKSVKEKTGAMVYVLLLCETHARFVPVTGSTKPDGSAGLPELVDWLASLPPVPTQILCKGVQRMLWDAARAAGFPGTLTQLLQTNIGRLSTFHFVARGQQWEYDGGHVTYRFAVHTRAEMDEGDGVPRPTTDPLICRVVRAWPLGRITDSNFQLHGKPASTVAVCVGAPLFRHDAFERNLGDPERGLRVRVDAVQNVIDRLLS